MDDAKFYDYMGNQAVSGETRKNMYSFFKGMAKDDMSKINKAVYGDLMVAVYENQADDQWVARAQKAVAAGQILVLNTRRFLMLVILLQARWIHLLNLC